MSAADLAGIVVRRVGAEVVWLARALVQPVHFVPGAVLVWLGLGLIGLVLVGAPVLVAWALVPLVLAVVARLWPRWLDSNVGERIRRRRIRHRVEACWEEVRAGAGLPDGITLERRSQWVGADLVLRPVVPPGVTAEDFEKTADRLASGLRAVRLRVRSPGPGLVEIAAQFTDPLAAPFEAMVPAADAPVTWDRVPIGLREDGRTWEWSIRVSTLTAGASGSGKGSLLWGLVIGLGPAVKASLVKLYGVDLKGGMELAMGRGLFEQVATTTDEATRLLVDISESLRARALDLAGVTRQHEPTVESPHVVVVVDELAALVAYADRKERERGEAAVNVILSQGRAVGFTLMAFVQDPKKEVVRNRGLFPASLGLRLRGREEVAMVLGEGARAAGATCDRIPLSMPGTGYVLADGDPYPVKVRAGYVTDDSIRLAVDRFGTTAPAPAGDTDQPEPAQRDPATDVAADTASVDEDSVGGPEPDETDMDSSTTNAGTSAKPSRRRGGTRRSPRATKERTPTC